MKSYTQSHLKHISHISHIYYANILFPPRPKSPNKLIILRTIQISSVSCLRRSSNLIETYIYIYILFCVFKFNLK